MFTFAHPAAILPIMRRRPWCAPALVIGTVIPHFAVFAGLPDSVNAFLHTPKGIFLGCLPAGILFFSFLAWVRNEIAATLPPQFRKLFEDLRLLELSWSSWNVLSILASLLLGSAIHVYLEKWIDPQPGTNQLLSTLGLVILVCYILYQLTRTKSLHEAFGNPEDSWIHGMWVALIITPAAIGLLTELIALRAHPITLEDFVSDGLNRAIGSFFAIYAIIVSFLKSRTPMPPVLNTPRQKTDKR